MRIQNINQGNYQHRNIGFKMNARAVVTGIHCADRATCEKLGIELASALQVSAINNGLVKATESKMCWTEICEGGFNVYMIGGRTMRKMHSVPEPQRLNVLQEAKKPENSRLLTINPSNVCDRCSTGRNLKSVTNI